MAKNKKKKKKTKTNPVVQTARSQSKTPVNTAAKKAAVYGDEKTSRKPVLAVVVGALLVIGLTYYFIPGKDRQEDRQAYAVSTPPVVQSAGVSQVEFPTSLFDDGQARHFVYKADGFAIKYFILKSSDGIIRAAFDACDVCWRAGKGYYQDGDVMVCRNCSQRFASVLVNVIKGGCNPAPLDRRIDGDKLVIDVNDIIQGKQYFRI